MFIDDNNLKRTVLQCILWFIFIPQAILVAINIYGWMLIRGEASTDEVNTALTLFGIEGSILFAAILVFWFFKNKGLRFGKQVSLASLITHVSYMLFFLMHVGEAIPNSIQPWILNEGNVGRWNITLFMPGAFISLYALTKGVFASIEVSKSGWITLGVVCGIPLLWYLFVSLLQPAWLGQVGVVGAIIIATLLVTVFLGALINIFDNLVQKEVTGNLVRRHYLAGMLLGLVAPIGGLYLNKAVPFPVDFQSTTVYVLTVINGLLLLLKPGPTHFLSVKVFLRFVIFPFIAYFFLVFLPFLPLSLLAIMLIGAGFLMLTPLALGLFQFRITQNDFRELRNQVGTKKACVFALSGLLVLPGYFIIEASLDKRALDKTLNYFYSHDFEGHVLSNDQINRSKKSLVQLRDRKSGVQLPYISWAYNSIVFGNMVLSDTKIEQAYQWLSNEKMPKYRDSAFGNREHINNRGRSFQRDTVPPKRDVTVSKVDVNRKKDSATVSIEMLNHSDDTHALFVTNLQVPEGVFVSGLRLKIEDKWVDGQIFDKKTALWVFQKITEVRRDPAIIYYTSPGAMELRVYPFPKKGIREVELDFVFHPELDSTIRIGEQSLDLNPSVSATNIVSREGSVIIDSSRAENLITRKPYLHFILDYSTGSKYSSSRSIEAIKQISGELGIKDLKVVAANISVSETRMDTMHNVDNIESIRDYIDNIEHPETAGFWMEQALASLTLRIAKNVDADSFSRKPVFVVIKGNDEPLDEISLNNWSWLIPDMNVWYSYQRGVLSPHEIDRSNPDSQVVAIRQNKTIYIAPANTSSIVDIDLSLGAEIYENAVTRFVPLTPKIEKQAGSYWMKFASIWLSWKKLNLNPAYIERERESLLSASRNNTVLLPVTSFIVVESASQWEIMARKEKQAMKSHSALDFEEKQKTSEPSEWLLLACLLAFIFYRIIKRTELIRSWRQRLWCQ
jgi:Vault protein inter-alpha-trypsin domain